MINKPTFGPAGNSESFYAEKYKSTTQAPAWLATRGLDAYEFQGGNGISAGDATLAKIGEEAKRHGILMSVHTPYYISLSGVEQEKRLKSLSYIEKSLHAAELLGADTIVIHSGSASKITREEAMALAKVIASKAPASIAGAKRVMYEARRAVFGASLLAEAQYCWSSRAHPEDIAEGGRAFAEKRTPNFKNR